MSEKPNFHLTLKRLKSSSSSESNPIQPFTNNLRSDDCLDTPKESENTSELIGSINDLHEEISQLENEVTKLRTELDKKQQEIENLRTKIDRERETTSLLDGRIDNLEGECLQAQQQNEAITAQLAETHEVERALQQELQNATAERTSLADTVEIQKRQIDRYKTQIDKMVVMAARIEELEFNLEKKSDSQNDLKTLCDDQKVRIEELKHKIAELTTDNIEAVSARFVAEAENSRLKNKNEDLTKEKLKFESLAYGKGEQTDSDLTILNNDDDTPRLRLRITQLEKEISSGNASNYKTALDRIRMLEENLDIAEQTKTNLKGRLEESFSRVDRNKHGDADGGMDEMVERFRTSEKIYCRLLKRCGIEILSLRSRIDLLSDKGK